MLRANSGEATNTNFTVFGLTQPGLEPMIYRTRGVHANHYPINRLNDLEDNLQSYIIFLKFVLLTDSTICRSAGTLIQWCNFIDRTHLTCHCISIIAVTVVSSWTILTGLLRRTRCIVRIYLCSTCTVYCK